MKKFIIFIAVFIYADVSDVILKIKEIENIKRKFLKIDYNMFETKNKEVLIPLPVIKRKKKEVKLVLNAIFNNKVNINGKWYKVKDKVFDYVIYKILEDKVVLKNGNKIIVLKIRPNILKVSK